MSAGSRLPGTPQPMNWAVGAGGVRLAYDSWGAAHAPLVVLLHGSGQTRHAWKGLGSRLAADGLRAVAVDTRGHGDSDWAFDGRYGVDVEIDDLQCLLNHLGHSRPVLIGASRGGGTSLVAIGEGHVGGAALVLVDIAPHVEAAGSDRIRAFMQQAPEGFATLAAVAAAIASYQPHRSRPRVLDGLAKNVRLGADGRYRWHWDPRSLFSREQLELRRARMESAAQRLQLPTLLVRGAESEVLSDAGVSAFRTACPHAEYACVSGAAHMVAGDRNDAFADAILDFVLRSLESTGGAKAQDHRCRRS